MEVKQSQRAICHIPKSSYAQCSKCIWLTVILINLLVDLKVKVT
jgi:hypothetical protein